VYAIVRCGGRQEKAAVDDVLTVDTLAGEIGSSVDLTPLLVVDDDKVISSPAELGRYKITAEILGAVAGPKISMIHYRNKTGYRRRLGHRQQYTQLKVTGISAAKSGAGKSSAAKSPAAKSPAAKSGAAKSSAGRGTAAKSEAAEKRV
jgi:large subunit ribosomal protein L21